MTTHSTGNSATKTVSIEKGMMEEADKRAKSLGLRSFSAYVQQLIKRDLEDRGDMILRETKTKSLDGNRY